MKIKKKEMMILCQLMTKLKLKKKCRSAYEKVVI